MKGLCYLNGDYLSLEDAKVSVLDRGFIFGEGVYEVIGVYRGQAFSVQRHLDRLNSNLRDMGVSEPLTAEEWFEVIRRLISLNNFEKSVIYIQVTRGPSPRNHEFPSTAHPTIFVMASPSNSENSMGLVHAVTAEDDRWMRCHVKNTSLYANTRLRNFAKVKGAAETILLRDGFVTEGASSNVFVVSEDKKVYTTPLSFNILPGLTRAVVLELAETMKIRILEEKISASRLKSANEIWLTNTSSGIRCVSRLDSEIIGNGIDYRVAKMLHELLVLEKNS